MYEHTVMTPLILRGPGIGRNQKTAAMVYLHELYPTLCDLLGIAIPSQVEGRSFARVIKAETSEFHSEVFSMYDDSQRMVRTARWKLIHYLRLGTYQLFNLEQDPWELANLADDPRHAGTLKDLQQRLRAWQKEQGDPALRGTHP